MKRLFVGIKIPKEIKTIITDYLDSFKRISKGWEKTNDLHLTLLFIGETDKIDNIKKQLSEIHFMPFELKINRVNFFSRRIMYLEVENSPELLNLKNQITENLKGEFPIEKKSFIPHITIKRWQRYEFEELSSLISEKPFSSVRFKVNQVALFESSKDDLGNKYHVLDLYP